MYYIIGIVNLNGDEMRTFVIGDIHGAYKALIQCLERSGFDKENDTLISIGDVCDGFNEVKACVNELLTIKNLIYIMGNHDDWFANYIKHGITPHFWLSQGGRATLESYNGGIPKAHQKLFLNSPYKYFDENRNQFFVHGGFSLEYEIKDQTPEMFMWERDMFLTVVKMSIKNPDKKIQLEDFSDVFIGHTRTGTQKPVHIGNLWNLDQSAGYDGWLTIMDVDTKEYWQSDCVLDLYGYNGRH